LPIKIYGNNNLYIIMTINRKMAISETGFIFNPTTGDSYSMNPIAMEILEMLKKEMSEEEIKKTLLEKYDVSKSILQKSYDEFIDTLKKLNIIE
jgi:PqqD family protein of HPr-rel-A system